MHPISEPTRGSQNFFYYVSREPKMLNICLASTEILINISIIERHIHMYMVSFMTDDLPVNLIFNFFMMYGAARLGQKLYCNNVCHIL